VPVKSRRAVKATPVTSQLDVAQQAWEDARYDDLLRDLEGSRDGRARLLRARVYLRRRDYEEAAALLRGGFDDPNDAAIAGILRTSASERSGSPSKEAPAPPPQGASRKVVAAAHLYTALAAWRRGDLEAAYTLASRAVNAGDVESAAFALDLQGWIEVSRRRFGPAARRFLETLDLLRDRPLRDEHLRASAFAALSHVALATFAFDLVPRLTSELASHRPTVDTIRPTLATMLQLSTLLELQADDLAAYEMLLAARSLNIEHPFPSLADTEIAAYHRRHNNDEARAAHLALAYRSLDDTNWVQADIEARVVPAVFAAEAALSDDPRAGSALTKALSFSGRRDPMLAFEHDKRAAAMVLLARGRVQQARGRGEAAAADVARAMDIFEAHGEGYLSAVASLDLMRITGKRELPPPLRAALRDAPRAWLRDELKRLRERSESPLEKLAPAERRVLEKLCEGATSREIATQLGRSVSTIRNQTISIFRKLDVHTRSALVAKVGARGHLP